MTMVDLDDAIKRLGGDPAVEVLPPPSAQKAVKDRRIFIICPTRGKIDDRVITCWDGITWPLNAERKRKFARGYEVGYAYDDLVQDVLDSPFGDFPYILTMEDDNLPPPDGVMKLLETAEAHPEFSAIAGLYRTKNPQRIPLVLGSVEDYRRTGRKDFSPIDVTVLPRDQRLVEVMAVPMGFTLWRMQLFRDVPAPWCRTVDERIDLGDGREVSVAEFDRLWADGKIDRSRGYQCRKWTQDVTLCAKAIDLGKRFVVDRAVDVGHLDPKTGVVY